MKNSMMTSSNPTNDKKKNIRILYVGMKYDYGIKEQGYSFEHYNFFDFLSKAGFEILYFDFMSLMQSHGKDTMNAMLVDTVKREQPDLAFFILFQDQIERATIEKISAMGKTITLNWFCDDHWRFHNFSQLYAPAFHYVTTTSVAALAQYNAIGYKNVIKTQWACNHFLYRPSYNNDYRHDVSFVGQPHGTRRDIIQSLELSGIVVTKYGAGWHETSRISQQQMIEVFSSSKININLSNASVQRRTFLGRLKKNSRQFLPFRLWRHTLDVEAEGQQIKGRNFEVPGCGGFLLTGNADNLSEYYQDKKEIVVFHTMKELRDVIRYYLQHDDERQQIALQGYKRTMQEHTYAHRFAHIFSIIGINDYAHYASMMDEQECIVTDII